MSIYDIYYVNPDIPNIKEINMIRDWSLMLNLKKGRLAYEMTLNDDNVVQVRNLVATVVDSDNPIHQLCTVDFKWMVVNKEVFQCNLGCFVPRAQCVHGCDLTKTINYEYELMSPIMLLTFEQVRFLFDAGEDVNIRFYFLGQQKSKEVL